MHTTSLDVAARYLTDECFFDLQLYLLIYCCFGFGISRHRFYKYFCYKSESPCQFVTFSYLHYLHLVGNK